MSIHLVLMVELFFILYYIPKTMTRLARARKRSAVGWSLIGIGAWLAGKLVVLLTFISIYALGIALWGWTENFSAGLWLFVYVTAMATAGGGLILAERKLDSQPKLYPLPPPPPEF